MSNRWYKKAPNDKVWWKDTDELGAWIFSFDKKAEFNMYRDYPDALTAEQKAAFDRENPYWANYFAGRT